MGQTADIDWALLASHTCTFSIKCSFYLSVDRSVDSSAAALAMR